MRLKSAPKIGDDIKNGFLLKRIVTKITRDKKHVYLCVEREGEERLLRYNPYTKSVAQTFTKF